MRMPLITVAMSAPLLFGAAAAQAMPAGAGASLAQTSHITLVSGGCGPGFHRGAFGRCRPNYGFGRRMSYGVGSGGQPRTTATGGNSGGYTSRN